MFGLNFSSKEEAYSFKSHLDKRYEQEKKSRKFVRHYCFLYFPLFLYNFKPLKSGEQTVISFYGCGRMFSCEV